MQRARAWEHAAMAIATRQPNCAMVGEGARQCAMRSADGLFGRHNRVLYFGWKREFTRLRCTMDARIAEKVVWICLCTGICALTPQLDTTGLSTCGIKGRN